MERQEMEALISEAVRDADLRPDEIPAIDLYMDQIIGLINEKLRDGSEHFSGRILTKTMINNYSKDGLISPIKGKKYSREQILQMLLVYAMKNTLSIGEIKRVLQNLYALPGFDGKMLQEVYLRFLEIKEYERGMTGEIVEGFVREKGLDLSDESDFFTLILALSAMSSYLKDAVQVLLESHYPDVDAERAREELEKKEEIKRQKKEEKRAAKAAKREGGQNAEATDDGGDDGERNS